MSERIKRVARAICKSRTCEGVSCCQWPAQGGRTDCPVDRGCYDDAARDAIEALRPEFEQLSVAYGGGDESVWIDDRTPISQYVDSILNEIAA